MVRSILQSYLVARDRASRQSVNFSLFLFWSQLNRLSNKALLRSIKYVSTSSPTRSIVRINLPPLLSQKFFHFPSSSLSSSFFLFFFFKKKKNKISLTRSIFQKTLPARTNYRIPRTKSITNNSVEVNVFLRLRSPCFFCFEAKPTRLPFEGPCRIETFSMAFEKRQCPIFLFFVSCRPKES